MPVWTKVLIIGFLIFITYNLFAGLIYMLKDEGKGDRVVKSLSWRIGISIVFFVLLMIGLKTGFIQGHGVEPRVIEAGEIKPTAEG